MNPSVCRCWWVSQIPQGFRSVSGPTHAAAILVPSTPYALPLRCLVCALCIPNQRMLLEQGKNIPEREANSTRRSGNFGREEQGSTCREGLKTLGNGPQRSEGTSGLVKAEYHTRNRDRGTTSEGTGSLLKWEPTAPRGTDNIES